MSPRPRVVAANALDTDQVNGKVLLGMRVPTVIISPFTRNTTGNQQVSHTLFDHTSILKLIEWRWGLKPLTPRDASSEIGNPATSFNFTSPNAALPTVPPAPSVFATPCFGGGIFSSEAVNTAATCPARLLELLVPFGATSRPLPMLSNGLIR